MRGGLDRRESRRRGRREPLKARACGREKSSLPGCSLPAERRHFSFATAGSGSWRGLPKGTNRWILAGACLAGPSAPEGSVDVMFTETVEYDCAEIPVV